MVKISCAIITAGESTLERAVESVRPYVDEVVGVLTRPSEADRVFPLFDECVVSTAHSYPAENGAMDGSGGVRDFGSLRRLSFDLASHDVKVWLDSDDTLVGGKHLRAAVESLADAPRFRLLAKYEYAYDPVTGEVLVEQWRERVVRGPYAWHRRVHEYLVADDGENADVRLDTVTWRHHRPPNQPWTDRNLRILLDCYAEEEGAEKDAWLRLNLGLELRRGGRFVEALAHLEAYVALSGRDDERALACTTIAECHLALGPTDPKRQEAAVEWCRIGQQLRRCFETVFAEAEQTFTSAAMRGDLEGIGRARDLVREALALGPTATPLAVKPRDFAFRAPDLLRVACETVGDWEGAADAARLALKAKPSDQMMVHHLGRYETKSGVRPALKAGKEVVIVCGPTFEKWDPAMAKRDGIGGSETAVIEVSRRLVARGHQVRVIADCDEEGIHEGVLWQPLLFLKEVGEPDVAICWRDAALLDECDGAKARLVWAHDVHVANMTPARALKAERVLGLSAWHCGELRRKYRLHPDQVVQTRNGIDLARFDRCANGWERDAKNPHRAVYSSSPDRGLAVMIDMWPAIREAVPDAELDVYYGFAGLDDVVKKQGGEGMRYYVESMKQRMLGLPGVTFHGRVDQQELARAMLAAGVWVLPTWFTETSCIGAMEAQAAGLRIVTSPIAALAETVGDRGWMVPGDWLSKEYQDEFVTMTVRAMIERDRLKDQPHWPKRDALQEYAREHFSWDGVVEQWEKLFDEVVAESNYGALVPYLGAAE